MPTANPETFKKKLAISSEDKTPSPEHVKMLSQVKGCVEKSREAMGKYYINWDYNDAVFRSKKMLDKEDRNALAKNQPAKFIVPLTYSQIMTFVAFGVATVTQDERFYRLKPTGTEDNPLTEAIELILDRDCRKNLWNNFLVQFFLDVGRFSLGCAEVCYTELTRKVRIPQTNTQEGAFGVTQETQTNAFVDVPLFLGNKVYPISPYRFFPDTTLPITRFQEGEYCASEDMFSLSSLRGDANLFNLDVIPKFSQKDYDDRRKKSRVDPMQVLEQRATQGSGTNSCVTEGAVIVTKVCIDITPKDFKVNDSVVLGDEDFPVRYIVWYANDNTIIRFEEAYYLHGMFPYVAAQFIPDQHQTVNESLADVCDQIQNNITWLINCAVTQKRSSLDGKFIVDPAGVDIKTLESRSPYIFLKKNASQTGVDRYIKQFDTKDNTTTYMQDAAQMKDLLENCSGFSGFMQGQPSSGRRSATQDRVVSQGASARGKTIVTGLWDSAFANLGKQLIANNRQEMDFDVFARIVGQGPHGPSKAISTEELYAAFHADPITIATAEDFFVFDSTQPSERAFLAQNLQEMFMAVASNPEIAMVLGYGPEQMRELFAQIYILRGVNPAQLPAPMPLPALGMPQNVLPGPGTPTAGGAAQPPTSVVQ